MNTAEMWLEAQESEKTYECINGDLAYCKYMGLVNKHDFYEPWGLEAWENEQEDGLDELMKCEWVALDETSNIMTIEEAEKRFGIKIVRD